MARGVVRVVQCMRRYERQHTKGKRGARKRKRGKVLKNGGCYGNIMAYKQFRHMNASYSIADEHSIFFRSYETDVFYFSNWCGLFFSFTEYTGTTTQKQITTFLRSNLFDSVSNGANIEKPYKTALKWVRNHYSRGVYAAVNLYNDYMVICVGNEYTRVSYDGKTLKKI